MQWISVKDKLPEINMPVLVLYNKTDWDYELLEDKFIECVIAVGSISRNNDGRARSRTEENQQKYSWHASNISCKCPLINVTHWKPLPELPKE